MQGVVPRLTRTPGAVHSAGPAVGAHTEEILKGLLGLDEAQLQSLRAQGAI